jgi:hypothetical protein
MTRDALAAARAAVEELGAERSSPALLQFLHALAVKTADLLDQSKSLSAEVKDFRLGLEISVIQAFADKIVGLLKVRDPLAETVHLSPMQLIAHSVSSVTTETARRALGWRPVSTPAPRA